MKRTRLLLADDHPLSPPENSRIHSGILLRLRKSAVPFALSRPRARGSILGERRKVHRDLDEHR